MKSFIFLVASPFLVGTVHAQEYPDISLDKLLSKTQQVEMGLQKLTSEEQENFRIFLIEKFLDGVDESVDVVQLK